MARLYLRNFASSKLPDNPKPSVLIQTIANYISLQSLRARESDFAFFCAVSEKEIWNLCLKFISRSARCKGLEQRFHLK